MRRTGASILRAASALLAVVFVVTLLHAVPAHGALTTCDCSAGVSGLAEATVVFTGELVGVTQEAPVAVLEFAVDTVFKGDVSASYRVASSLDIAACGLGPAPPAGRWLVYGTEFPPGSGAIFTNACSGTSLLAADEVLPEALGAGRPPPGAPPPTVPVTIGFSASTAPASVTEADRGISRPIILTIVGLALIGVVARVLAGRRNAVVRTHRE
jgi:hypothetical protein